MKGQQSLGIGAAQRGLWRLVVDWGHSSVISALPTKPEVLDLIPSSCQFVTFLSVHYVRSKRQLASFPDHLGTRLRDNKPEANVYTLGIAATWVCFFFF